MSIAGKRKKGRHSSGSSISSDSGVISTIEVQAVVDRLSMERFRDSTKQMYY